MHTPVSSVVTSRRTAVSGHRVIRIVLLATPLAVVSTWLIAGRYAEEMTKRREIEAVSIGRQLGMAALQYAQYHNGRLPAANHWEDDLKPYLGTITATVPPPYGAHTGHRFAINTHIAGHTIYELDAPDDAVLFFESTSKGPNAADDVTSIPTNADGSTTVAITYADGHVYTHSLDSWHIWWSDPDFRKKSLGELTKE